MKGPITSDVALPRFCSLSNEAKLNVNSIDGSFEHKRVFQIQQCIQGKLRQNFEHFGAESQPKITLVRRQEFKI